MRKRTPCSGVPLVFIPETHAIVIGAGRVGVRKARALLRSGIPVWLVDREARPSLPSAAHFIRTVVTKGNASQLVRGSSLVVAATSDPALNRHIASACRRARILVNVADDPWKGSFTMPAVARHGPLTIAVSTSGTSPTLAKAIRKHVEGQLPRWSRILRDPTSQKGSARPRKRRTLHPGPS